jgi:hypothetical protein
MNRQFGDFYIADPIPPATKRYGVPVGVSWRFR